MSLILSSDTKNVVDRLSGNLPQATLLTGETGVGLGTVARLIAGRHLSGFIEPLNIDGKVDHQTGTISVSRIRELYQETRGKYQDKRVLIIDDADQMSHNAQAAFLKLLEEPNESTYFILTSHYPQQILPTVRSRAQVNQVKKLTERQTNELLLKLNVTDAKKQTQLKFIAQGLPAELTRLSSDEKYFADRAEIMIDTRTFLTGSAYSKLIVVNKYHKDKQKSLQLVESALAVTNISLKANPQKSLVDQLDRLLRIKEKIEANRNTRLQLMAFVVY